MVDAHGGTVGLLRYKGRLCAMTPNTPAKESGGSRRSGALSGAIVTMLIALAMKLI